MTKWDLPQECKMSLTSESQPMYYIPQDTINDKHMMLSIDA